MKLTTERYVAPGCHLDGITFLATTVFPEFDINLKERGAFSAETELSFHSAPHDYCMEIHASGVGEEADW